MSVKAKTKRRLVILVAAAIGIIGGGVGLWGLKTWKTNRWYQSERDLGFAAVKDGTPAVVIYHLGHYLNHFPNDVDALKLYANERLLVEASDSAHVREANSFLLRLVDLTPGDMEPRRQLMQFYSRYGYTTEALDVANTILTKNPGDVEATKYKLSALIRLRRWDQALLVAESWSQLIPDDPDPILRVMGLMAQMDRPANEILSRAKKAGIKDPNGPMAELTLGVGYALTGDIPSAQKLLRLTAAQKLPSTAFARVTVDQLNRAGLYDDSLQLLQRLAKEGDDSDIRRALVRRMWELNHATEVVELTKDTTKLGVEAAAFRAMALAQLGRADEANQVAAQIQTGKGDLVADAWAEILQQQLKPGSVDARKLLDDCQKAASKDSEGGYLHYFMGQAYAELDEGDLAIEIWQKLAVQNPTWALPLVRLSDMRLAKGRYNMAMLASQEAVRRSPGSALAAINLAKVWAASVESGQVERPEDLLKLIESIRKELPHEEQTLSMQISLLGKLGRKDEATRAIKTALEAKDAPSPNSLLRLAAISRAYDLGLADQCFDRFEKAYGVTADLAYARAVHKFSRSDAAGGLASLQADRTKAKDPNALPWQMAWARYLEVTQDSRAKDEWIRLADKYTQDRQIQQAAISVRSTRIDREFMDRAIDRLRKLTGDEGVSWKLARARWMMDGAKSDQDLAQAVILLKDIVRTTEDLIEPRVLLAQAYERLNNPNGAVDELRAAAIADPSNTQVALYLSRLFQKRGDFDKAREALDKVAKGKVANVDQKRQAAVLMAQQGDAKRAIELLQGAGDDDKDPSNALLLAMLYRQRNELGKAEEIVKKLLVNPEPVVVQFAADLYAMQGRRADADQVLTLLDKMTLKPGIKELLLADHACRFLGSEEAIKRFNAALKAAPENATAWRALAGYYAFLGRGKDLTDTAVESIKHVPDDASLKAVAAETELLAAADSDAETRPLVIAYIGDPKPESPALAGIRVIATSKKNQETPDQTATKLKKLVDESPQFAPLQYILIHRYTRQNRAEDASQLAARAVQMFPNDADPARLAFEAAASAQHWGEALGFATAWRDRVPSNPLPADMAISTALLQLGRAANAADQIASYIPTAVAHADQNGAPVIYQYCSALNVDGQADKAAAILWPLAEKNGDWRKVWMQLSLRCTDPRTTEAWLNRVDAVVPADAQEERAVLAGAWHVLGTRTHSDAYLATSNNMFDKLLANPSVTATTVMARGMAAEQDSNFTVAESAYRRALKLDPTLLVAQNNLAMLLVHRNGDVNEALKLAKAAVDQRPGTATLHDTLALVQAKAKDVDGAVASMKHALELEPNSLDWHVHLAQILLDGGRRKEVGRVLSEIAALPAGRTPPSEQTRQQLEAIQIELSKQSSANVQQ